jgi:hypothetical protein
LPQIRQNPPQEIPVTKPFGRLLYDVNWDSF